MTEETKSETPAPITAAINEAASNVCRDLGVGDERDTLMVKIRLSEMAVAVIQAWEAHFRAEDGK